MSLDVNVVEGIVKKVLDKLDDGGAPVAEGPGNFGVYETMDQAVEAAAKAQQAYLGCTMSDRALYVDTIRKTVLQQGMLERISREAVEQTGMGNLEDKIQKNILAATKSPGIEDLTTDAMSGDDGLTIVEYSPFGVIGAITPTTNPTETITCNAIAMLASGNSVVFSPHPRAKKLSIYFIQELNRALRKVGAPEYLITTVSEPSIENTNAMMNHPKVRMLVATGGPGIVKTVLSSGKKAIGAGAGNPPAVVDETANIEKAAKDIIDGSTFDNNLPCTSEKEVIAVEAIADYLIFNMKANGAVEVKDPAQIKRLEEVVLNEKGGPKTEYVGKSAVHILKAAGMDDLAKDNPRVIIMQVDVSHPFVQEELMMCILPIVRVPDVETAIQTAIAVEHGYRHTAIMHSRNVDMLTRMGKLIQTTIFVKNGPSYAGIGVGGEGFTTFTIAGPTGEGLTSARTFARRRRCTLVGGFDVR